MANQCEAQHAKPTQRPAKAIGAASASQQLSRTVQNKNGVAIHAQSQRCGLGVISRSLPLNLTTLMSALIRNLRVHTNSQQSARFPIPGVRFFWSVGVGEMMPIILLFTARGDINANTCSMPVDLTRLSAVRSLFVQVFGKLAFMTQEHKNKHWLYQLLSAFAPEMVLSSACFVFLVLCNMLM